MRVVACSPHTTAGIWIIQEEEEEDGVEGMHVFITVECTFPYYYVLVARTMMVPCSLFLFSIFKFFVSSSFSTSSNTSRSQDQEEKREREREREKHIFENDVDTDNCIHIDKGCGVDNAGCALDDYYMDETSRKT